MFCWVLANSEFDEEIATVRVSQGARQLKATEGNFSQPRSSVLRMRIEPTRKQPDGLCGHVGERKQLLSNNLFWVCIHIEIRKIV